MEKKPKVLATYKPLKNGIMNLSNYNEDSIEIEELRETNKELLEALHSIIIYDKNSNYAEFHNINEDSLDRILKVIKKVTN